MPAKGRRRDGRRIALTVKLAPETYVKLCRASASAQPRRTHQDILETALERYLESAGGQERLVRHDGPLAEGC